MVGADRVMMRVKELRRVPVIRQAMEKKLTQVKAGALVGLPARQVRCLIQRVRQEGDRGLVHRGRGKPSNRRSVAPLKAKGLTLYEQRYGDVGLTLAAEKLAERHGITISDETGRRWRQERGVDHCQRRKRPHRAWRASRKPDIPTFFGRKKTFQIQREVPACKGGGVSKVLCSRTSSLVILGATPVKAWESTLNWVDRDLQLVLTSMAGEVI